MLSRISKKRKPFLSYGYLSVFGRPIDSLALHSLFEFNVEVLRFASVQFAWAPLPSVVLGSMALRLLMEGVGMFTKDLKFQNYGNRSSHIVINNAFNVDLERDIKFYVRLKKTQNIPSVQANTLRKYYSPNQCFKYLFNGYLMINIGRSLNLLLNDERYNSFLLLDPYLNLVNIDPTFITPIIAMIVNYFLMTRSLHPFLVHLRQRKLDTWSLAFMGGLLFVPLPLVKIFLMQLYQSVYIGFMSTHIALREIKRLLVKYRQRKTSKMFQYAK